MNAGLEGNIMQANRQSADFFGIDAGELPGRNLANLISEEGCPAVVEILNTLRNGSPRAVRGMTLATGVESRRGLLVSAGVAAGGRIWLLLFVDMTDVHHPASSA